MVQVYVSAPWGRLEKPYQELKAWEKTKLLAPGESQQLTLTIPLDQLSSYDEESASYLLEAGTYYIRVGNSSRNTHIAGSLLVPSPVICAQYSNCLGLKPCNRNKLAFLSAQNISPITYPGEEQEKQV